MALAVLASAGMVPAAGATVVAGPNGPFVFTSGRDDGATTLSDAHAQIWFLSGPNGSAQRLTTLGLSHHRHASWSPDRTKIAYARGPDDGTPFDGPWDIFVLDLSTPGSVPVNITNTLSTNEDRPNWSPDGTRLAYAKQKPMAGWDVVTKDATGAGTETIIADDASAGPGNSGQFSRPQWSLDGQSIFYGKIISAGPPPDYDIYRAASDGSDHILGGTPIVAGTTNDYQAALSPDGTRLCFTREDPVNGKDVNVVSSAGGTAAPLLTTDGVQEYECAWSPDGTKIAFVRGAFGAGQILMKSSTDPIGSVDPVTDVAGRFDGNPEWTYNPSPTCNNGTASVAFNSFVSIPLPCSDLPDPPNFGPNSPFGPDIVTPPAHGVLGGISNDSVIYTPNVNFQGQDSFTFKSDDGTSDSAPATIAITVSGPVVNPPPPPGAAIVEALSVSPRRWRRGSALPVVSLAPVGTTIRVQLSAAGRVTLRFRRARPGRRVRGRCVRPTRLNRNRPRCTRYVRAGRFSFDGKQGNNSVRFQGRLTRRKRLPIGRYRMSARVTANGQTSPARTVRFRIVRR
jgi:Tol biopolymer transport system component